MKSAVLFVFLGVFVTTLFTFHGYANTNFLYYEIRWLDVPMHFLGGFGLGLGTLWLYFLSGFFQKDVAKRIDEKGLFLYMFSIAVLSSLILGGIWEVYEFGVDTLFNYGYPYNTYDTLSDFFFDAVGGALAAILFYLLGLHKRYE